jgi:hypothetical protein
MIYFIKNATGYIKIGYSRHPWSRLKQLQTGSSEPLEMLYIVDGDFQTEKYLHNHFSFCHYINEWFCPSESLLYLIHILQTPQEKRTSAALIFGPGALLINVYARLGITYTPTRSIRDLLESWAKCPEVNKAV